jgi:hypothetical protein
MRVQLTTPLPVKPTPVGVAGALPPEVAVVARVDCTVPDVPPPFDAVAKASEYVNWRNSII